MEYYATKLSDNLRLNDFFVILALNRCPSFQFNAVVHFFSLLILSSRHFSTRSKWSLQSGYREHCIFGWETSRKGSNVIPKFVQAHAHVLRADIRDSYSGYLCTYSQHSRWHELLIKSTSTQVVGRSTCSFTPLHRSFYLQFVALVVDPALYHPATFCISLVVTKGLGFVPHLARTTTRYYYVRHEFAVQRN